MFNIFVILQIKVKRTVNKLEKIQNKIVALSNDSEPVKIRKE